MDRPAVQFVSQAVAFADGALGNAVFEIVEIDRLVCRLHPHLSATRGVVCGGTPVRSSARDWVVV